MPETEDAAPHPAGRRAPAREVRQRDAERSRELLLGAALDEFAAKGFAGARVQDIAERAGVNKQLITYYFGGKEGLFRAIEQRWLALEASFARSDLPLDELLAEYLHATLADPRLLRLHVWNGLTEWAETPEQQADDTRTKEDLADFQRRQEAGEIAADLDPGLVMLAFMGAVAAPIIMPQVVRHMTGLDFDAPEFEQAYAENLRRMIRYLAAD